MPRCGRACRGVFSISRKRRNRPRWGVVSDGGFFREIFRAERPAGMNGGLQGFFAARMDRGGMSGQRGFLGDGHGDFRHFRGQNKKRGAVGGVGLALAPVPEFAQNGSAARPKSAALDAPDFIFIHHDRWKLHDEARATFLVHASRPLARSSEFNFSSSGLEIMRVVAGVNLHFFREGDAAPSRLLRTFVQFHAEKFFHEAAQAELPFAQQPGGEHGVENDGWREFVVFSAGGANHSRRHEKSLAAGQGGREGID